MKVLKSIMYVYLGMLFVFLIGLFVVFPILLSEYFENENYLFLFLINIPALLGFLFHYSGEPINYRPKR